MFKLVNAGCECSFALMCELNSVTLACVQQLGPAEIAEFENCLSKGSVDHLSRQCREPFTDMSHVHAFHDVERITGHKPCMHSCWQWDTMASMRCVPAEHATSCSLLSETHICRPSHSL
jgi:hypothetical protein